MKAHDFGNDKLPGLYASHVNLKAVLDAMTLETFMHLPHINAGSLPSPHIQGNCTVSLEIADVLVNKRHPYIRWYTLYGGHPPFQQLLHPAVELGDGAYLCTFLHPWRNHDHLFTLAL